MERLRFCSDAEIRMRVLGAVEGEVPYRSGAMVLEALARGVDGVVAVDNRLEWGNEDVAGRSILDTPVAPAPASL